MTDNGTQHGDVLVRHGVVAHIGTDLNFADAVTVDLNGKALLPGLVDVHVHLRQPGFAYKETIATGTKAAVAAGYTALCSMPNLNPMPDTLEHLRVETDIIARNARTKVYPYGCITRGEEGLELVDFVALQPHVCAFSDDGRGVQTDNMMLQAMQQVKRLDGLIAAHCEVNALVHGGCIHDGYYAAEHGHKGICSESEWKQVERDIALSARTGCRYHVCHISTKESVELVRQAKRQGLKVTCETAPHYLLLCDEDLREDGRFKMNPPLRSCADRNALLQGIIDGTIDVIATDHAPHTAAEKNRGLEGSLFGIVGLETAFPLMYTYLVKKKIITMQRLIELMCMAPRKIFRLDGGLRIGEAADLTIMDLHAPHKIDSRQFHSMGKATPFDGWQVDTRCVMTMIDGKIAFQA